MTKSIIDNYLLYNSFTNSNFGINFRNMAATKKKQLTQKCKNKVFSHI